MAWTVLCLTPKREHWADLHNNVLEDTIRINAIVYKADPSLCPVHFDVRAMFTAASLKAAENDCHANLIHPDIGNAPDEADPRITAGMTENQAVHFKLAYSDKYDIEVLPDRPDGEA